MAKYTCRVQANDHYAIVEKVDRPEPNQLPLRLITVLRGEEESLWITACLNACKDIPRESLEKLSLDKAHIRQLVLRDETISRLASQKDQLTEFAESCAQYLGDGTAGPHTYREIVSDIGNRARALLAALATEDGVRPCTTK